MDPISPLEVIARATKLNPQITKILIAVPVLLACVALSTRLVSDVQTAVLGGILVIFAAVVLFAVASIRKDQLGSAVIWFVRFCLFAFCFVSSIDGQRVSNARFSPV